MSTLIQRVIASVIGGIISGSIVAIANHLFTK